MNQWEMIEILKQNPTKKAKDSNQHTIYWKHGILYQDDKPFEIYEINELFYTILD